MGGEGRVDMAEAGTRPARDWWRADGCSLMMFSARPVNTGVARAGGAGCQDERGLAG